MKVRLPDDPIIRLVFEWNLEERPEWGERLEGWLRKNGVSLEV
ncbi:MAG: hypothetical protein ABC585_05670 [Candidatus Methanosuratincola petrocarbonis]